MYQKFKTSFQIFFFLALSAVFLMSLTWLFTMTSPQDSSQTSNAPFQLAVDRQAGITVALEKTAQSGPLSLSKQAQVTSTTGSFATFIILITNTSTSTISNISFTEIPDSSLSLVGDPQFSNVDATNAGDKIWNLNNLVGNTTAVITVETQLLSECDITAQNEVSIEATDVSAITAQDQVIFEIGKCVYFPVIRKDPTPTPTATPTPVPILYFHDFNGDEDWAEGKSNDDRCDSKYDSNTYLVEIDGEINNDNDEIDGCFRPAPDEAEYKYGLFEVDARQASGGERFVYGIYINGDGGEEQYLFRIAPDDDCGWDLIRNENNENPDEKLNGGCDSAINRNDATNRLAIRHTSDGRITVYVNGKQLGTYVDSDQLNDGNGTGLYVQSDGDEDNRIRFDNFRVKDPNAPLTP